MFCSEKSGHVVNLIFLRFGYFCLFICHICIFRTVGGKSEACKFGVYAIMCLNLHVKVGPVVDDDCFCFLFLFLLKTKRTKNTFIYLQNNTKISRERNQPTFERETNMVCSSPFWKQKCENLKNIRLIKSQFIEIQSIYDWRHLSTVLVH